MIYEARLKYINNAGKRWIYRSHYVTGNLDREATAAALLYLGMSKQYWAGFYDEARVESVIALDEQAIVDKLNMMG